MYTGAHFCTILEGLIGMLCACRVQESHGGKRKVKGRLKFEVVIEVTDKNQFPDRQADVRMKPEALRGWCPLCLLLL